ncbi:toxin Cry1Ac domain D-VI-related protein [Brevibacillus choshinensis]|uniref:Ig-like domain-containing protein n=1 Tax=Brevibacillus choshinensis TaxID=54911 RepID=A0ABX7FP99_BRECH|nr:toxin Cry1Ac domain D-VI-related protein [Brevibacillus choshinensis]QRG67514.1 Ig-like domain-containing protein [Brevibacillus choshinensis]
MSKRNQKSKSIVTAVVSAGFLLSAISHAFAETSTPASTAKVSQAEARTVTLTGKITSAGSTANENREQADNAAKKEAAQEEKEEITATNGLITVTFQDTPDKAPSPRNFQFTLSVDGKRPQRISIRSFIWLEQERKALISFSPLRAAKEEQTVTIAMKHREAEATAEPFTIAGKGAEVDRVEIFALAEDAQLYTDKKKDKLLKLLPVAYDDQDRVVTGKVNWRTADKKVATVNSVGAVTAKGTGVTDIIAKVGDVESYFEVWVNDEELPDRTELSVREATIEEAEDNDGRITAKQTIKLKNGSFRSDISEEDIKANNLPDGLAIKVERDSEDELTVSFTGKAKKHAQTDSRNDVSFTVDKRKIKRAKADVTTENFTIRFKDPVIVSPPVDPPPQPDYLAIARRAVAGLFTDNTKTALKPGVTQETIDAARNKVERLGNSVPDKAGLQEDVKKAQQLYDQVPGDSNLEEARQAVEALYTDNDKVELRPDTTEADIDAAKTKVEAVSDSEPEKAELLDYIEKAKKLFFGPRILRKGDAQIYLGIGAEDSLSSITLLDDVQSGGPFKHKMSEYVEAYMNNKPGSFSYDPNTDQFNVIVDGADAGYVKYGYDEDTLTVLKDEETRGVTFKAAPDASEGDTSYLTFAYTNGDITTSTVEIPVYFDATLPKLVTPVQQADSVFTLHASEPLDEQLSGQSNSFSRLFDRVEIALNGDFDDTSSGNVKDFAEAVFVTVSGNEITVTLRSDFIDQLGQAPTADTQIRFTTRMLRDRAGNRFDPDFNSVTAKWDIGSPD